MIAASRYTREARRGDRALAILLAALIHAGLALLLLRGFTVEVERAGEAPLRLIDVNLAPPPPLPPPPPVTRREKIPDGGRKAVAPIAMVAAGGAKAREPSRASVVAPAPVIALPVPTIAASGGNVGVGPASAGAGQSGGQGGDGNGAGNGAGGGGGGGTDLYQIAGSIGARDYPRDLRDRGVGGRVEMIFTVSPTGRVSRCVVTRSSGVPELDELTCRLIRQRFVFRPETGPDGRPIAADVDGEHLWTARGRH